VITSYEVQSGRQTISVLEAHNAQQAIIDFLRSLGCRDDEMVRLSPGAVSWRGAIFRAVPVSDAPEEVVPKKRTATRKPSRRSARRSNR
jgi:hypothetical protein